MDVRKVKILVSETSRLLAGARNYRGPNDPKIPVINIAKIEKWNTAAYMFQYFVLLYFEQIELMNMKQG